MWVTSHSFLKFLDMLEKVVIVHPTIDPSWIPGITEIALNMLTMEMLEFAGFHLHVVSSRLEQASSGMG